MAASKFLWIIALFFLLSAGISYGSRQKVPVLVYHDIVNSSTPDPGRPDQIPLSEFKEQMRYLHDHGYTTISLDELVNFMKGGDIPKQSIVLTFDDGWKSTTGIIPILKQYHFKAAFFVIIDMIDLSPYMNWKDILDLAKDPDFQIESHTMSHPWKKGNNLLTWIDGTTPGRSAEDAEYELYMSKYLLGRVLNRNIKYLAWPMGWYNEKLMKMARADGYTALFTVRNGANSKGGDVLRVRRMIVDGFCGMPVFREVLKNYEGFFKYGCESKE
jgi:peptidoglycan/xylan/chitin deacetylase (PgdA/CDA1 family)